MIRNRKGYIAAIAAMFIISSLFSGCQLAKEAYSTVKNTDRLCGVFVTIGSEALNHIRKEPGASDLIKNSNNNNEIKINKENLLTGSEVPSSNHDNKIYGMVKENGTVDFDGIDGYYMGLVNETNSNGIIEGTSINTDRTFFQDTHLSVNIRNDAEENSCEGSLYIAGRTNKVVHVNPVYQSDDGTYYTLIMFGQSVGYLFNGDTTSAGEVFSQSISNSFATTTDGKKRTQKTSFNVKFIIENEAKQILIKEINQKDELIKTTVYKRTASDKYIVNAATDYVIVEEYLKNSLGSDKVERSIYSLTKDKKNDEIISHPCYFEGKDGVMYQKSIEFMY